MKIELNTNVAPIVIPDTYGTGWQYMVKEGMWGDMETLYKEKGQEYIQDAVNETDTFKNAEINVKCFDSPSFYNYGTDWLEFDMEFDDDIIDTIKLRADKYFFEYAKRKFGSRPGFISFYPVEETDFNKALDAPVDTFRYTKERAIAMYLMYEIEKQIDLDKLHEEYLYDIYEYAASNGYFEDDEDEDE